MNQLLLDEEVAGIDSYAELLKHWKRQSLNQVIITTLESETLDVEISAEGWKVNDHEVYPTLESLLKTRSPQFENAWNNELSRRLKLLEQ